MDGEGRQYPPDDSIQSSQSTQSANSNSYGPSSIFSTSLTVLADQANSSGSDLSPSAGTHYPLGPLRTPPLETAPTTFGSSWLGRYALPSTQSIWLSTSTNIGPLSETPSWMDGGSGSVFAGFASGPDIASLTYQASFGGDIASLPYGAAMASGSSTAAWGATAPGDAFPTSLSSTEPSQSTSSADPHLEKGKRKRGRPRLYDDDGVLRRKDRPARPAARSTIGPEPPTSVSSPESLIVAELTWPTSTSASSRARRTSTQDGEDGDPNPERSEAVRARNKAAAARYRAKTQNAIATMEAEEREVSIRRQALLATAGRLRDEVFQLKNEVLRHADCGCPLILGYLSDAARRAYMNLGDGGGSGDGGSYHVEHIPECPQRQEGGGWTGGYTGAEDGELDGG